MGTQSTNDEVRSRYETRVQDLNQTLAWRKKTCRLMQLLRGLFFVLLLIATIGAFQGLLPGALAYIIPGIPLVALFAAAAFNETLEGRQETDRIRRYLVKLQLARLDRQWNSLPVDEVPLPKSHQILINDLDLVGEASLFQLVNTAHTPLGKQTLAHWLTDPAEPGEIITRQQAVRELTDQANLREELQLLAYSVSQARTDPGEMLEWAKGRCRLPHHDLIVGLARFLAAAMVLTWVLFFVVSPAARMIVGGIGLALIAINLILTIAISGSIHRIFNSVAYHQRDIANYVNLFQLARRIPQNASRLEEIRQTLATGKTNAVAATSGLKSIIGAAQMRRAGLFFLVYLVLQLLFLIDFQVLAWLERWHRKHASRIPDWLLSVAEWESLASFANLAQQNPDWCFPVVDPASDRVAAERIGHPLIPESQRVANDVTVGPRNTILLVTGSNMSGKSTMLRSIGINCALAQAGSVVCAAELKLPPVQIETSMRIGDSISEGVSFFMAELKRLKQIAVQAEKLANDPRRTLLFLLDEILQGTNSRERQIAVIRVCEHLLDCGAIGAISTHDLELADSKKLKSKCRIVHFREFFEKGTDGKQMMKFDYRMRNGISPTTNALKLLELVGLGEAMD